MVEPQSISFGKGAITVTNPDFVNGFQAGHLAYMAALKQHPEPYTDADIVELFLEKLESSRLLANREARLAAAYRELMQESIRPTGDTLSKRAHCNRAAALNWLKTKQIAG